jgi:hypothetical protein
VCHAGHKYISSIPNELANIGLWKYEYEIEITMLNAMTDGTAMIAVIRNRRATKYDIRNDELSEYEVYPSAKKTSLLITSPNLPRSGAPV